jgi:hypothetical protein
VDVQRGSHYRASGRPCHDDAVNAWNVRPFRKHPAVQQDWNLPFSETKQNLCTFDRVCSSVHCVSVHSFGLKRCLFVCLFVCLLVVSWNTEISHRVDMSHLLTPLIEKKLLECIIFIGCFLYAHKATALIGPGRPIHVDISLKSRKMQTQTSMDFAVFSIK